MGAGLSSHYGLKNKYVKERLKKFDPNEIEMLYKIYKELSSRSSSNGIDKETFLQYFNLPGLWGEQLFRKFDCNYSGAVELEEFLLGISVSCRGTRSEKIFVLFKLFDLNNDNLIHKFELMTMLSNFPQISKYLYTSIDKSDSIFNTRNRNLKILDRNFTLNSRILNSFSSNDNHGENSNRDTPTNKLYHINERELKKPVETDVSASSSTSSTTKVHRNTTRKNDFNARSLTDFSFDSKSLTLYINNYYKDCSDNYENFNYITPNHRKSNAKLTKRSYSLTNLDKQNNVSEYQPNKYDLYLENFDSSSFEASEPDDDFSKCDDSNSMIDTWNDEEFPDVNSYATNEEDSMFLIKSIINEYEENEDLERATMDLEMLVDHIFEECEFNETGSLNFQKFKAWLEKNDSILTMFSECLHEEVWGLDGNAFHREKSFSGDAFDKISHALMNSHEEKNDHENGLIKKDMEFDENTIRTIYQIFLVKGKHPFAYTLENNPNSLVSEELVEHMKTMNNFMVPPLGMNHRNHTRDESVETGDRFFHEIFACPNCKTPFLMCPVCYKKHNALSLHIELNNVYITCSECCSSNEKGIGVFTSCWICCWSFNDIFTSQSWKQRSDSIETMSSSQSVGRSSKDSSELKISSSSCFEKSSSKFDDDNDNLNFNITTKAGVMFKIGKTLHQWKSRYYVLIGNILYYYKDKSSTRPRGCIFLEGCYLHSLRKRRIGNKYGFSIFHKGTKISKRDFYVDTMSDFLDWVEVLTHAMKQQTIANKYEICEALGQGKFSVVYRGVSRKTGVEYAVKIIDKNKITHQERELLRSEISILKLLKHNNVIYLKEIIDMKDTLYIIMELVRGGELYDLIHSEHRLSESHTHRIISQLLQTVAYLHNCGIVHRDLKPENLLLTDKTELASIKLTDFGLSTLCGPNDILIQPCGTLAYVAPEVLTMQGYNQKSDVWSIGVIMYLLIRGRLPFPIKRANTVNISDHYKLTFDGPIWKSTSSSARDLIKKLLEIDPIRRISVFEALDHIWVKNFVAVDHDSPKISNLSNQVYNDEFYQSLTKDNDNTFVLPYSETCNNNLKKLDVLQNVMNSPNYSIISQSTNSPRDLRNSSSNERNSPKKVRI
ncbi:Protein kinase domain protein [Theileria parva strain Muguga]|uniref:non-specific serine/threonine protein kinase n=1 Tax=Theileria parva TaxID=5875 RepID=Q4N248_THEPA|nr:Protein kinase domain protein [Theileria parva strain Muguga]EAN31870.1 Protein kinase domain protein [Theileria parva strain Muguga]|eukprot:XP_764153.1 protein kinase [Theileria parva strain Muguga]